MSDQHDLSLLTDEERAIVARYERGPNLYHHQEYLAARRNVNLLANALIAARAENKRLSMGMCEVCHTQSWEPTLDGFRCSYCWLLAENVRLLDEGRSLHDRLVNSVEENKRLREIADATRKAQSVLAKWIVPDSELSDADCLNALLEILDTTELVETQRALLHSEKGGE